MRAHFLPCLVVSLTDVIKLLEFWEKLVELFIHADINLFFKKILQWAIVEGVDLIFRIVCQISDQDNKSYKI